MKILACSWCGKQFERYNISVKRAAKPQYCARRCQHAALSERAKAKQAARLWSRIDVRGENECWPWTGRQDPNGYGRIDIDNRPMLAHRLIFESVTGEKPEAVLHSCDNPPCCNPAHLRGGTLTDNNRDMDAKGRRVYPRTKRGRDCNTSKLTNIDVLAIFFSNEPRPVLAERYGVSNSAVRYIKIGKKLGMADRGKKCRVTLVQRPKTTPSSARQENVRFAAAN